MSAFSPLFTVSRGLSFDFVGPSTCLKGVKTRWSEHLSEGVLEHFVTSQGADFSKMVKDKRGMTFS